MSGLLLGLGYFACTGMGENGAAKEEGRRPLENPEKKKAIDVERKKLLEGEGNR